MRFRAITAVMLSAAVFIAAGSSTASAQTQNENKTPKPTATTATAANVVVQPGDYLSKIATTHGTTYIRLFDANAQIVYPDLIHPGDTIRIPGSDEQLASRPLPSGEAPVLAQPKDEVSVATTQRQSASSAAVTTASSDIWDRLAQCESGGNWSINTGNGFYGGIQFTLSSWRAVGGSGYPNLASKSEQIARGEMLKARQGWAAWPACTLKLGLR